MVRRSVGMGRSTLFENEYWLVFYLIANHRRDPHSPFRHGCERPSACFLCFSSLNLFSQRTENERSAVSKFHAERKTRAKTINRSLARSLLPHNWFENIGREGERERDVIYIATTLKGFFHRWEMRSAFFQLGTWNPRDNEWTLLDFVWIIEISRSKGCSRSVDLRDWLKERRINRLMKSVAFLYDCSLN